MIFYEEDLYAIEAISDRANNYDWYVLLYDPNTTDYGNEIEFQTFDEAERKFNNTEPTEKYQVELMFAPVIDDEKYKDNVVVRWKTFDDKKIEKEKNN